MKKDRRSENQPASIPGGIDRRIKSMSTPISTQMPAAPLRDERASHDPRARAPLPVAERIGAGSKFTGRGIVAAFLDSGFYAHADLTTPHSRIHGYYDLIGGK